MKLQLTITIEYNSNGCPESTLTDVLHRSAMHLYDEGLLTTGTEAEVESWAHKVTGYPEPEYTEEDWRHEVMNRDTVLGYEEWCEHQRAANAIADVVGEVTQPDTDELLEALADIAHAAGHAKYYGGDSRQDVQDFITWAREFEAKYRGTHWGQEPDFLDYIETIDNFAAKKLNHE